MIEAKLFAYELLEELRRDLPFLDFASLALPADEAEACVVAKAEGILAGAEEAAEFLKLLGFQLTKTLPDGARVKPGDEGDMLQGACKRHTQGGEDVAEPLDARLRRCDLHKEAR
jgi:nicotinate-nucleotide pyrophosphorylase